MSEQRAHQASCVSAVGAFAIYFQALQRPWPLKSREEALTIGGIWLALTTIFEFCFGRLMARKSWPELLSEYNLAKGRLWLVVLAWIAIGPEITRRQAQG
jgi:hypothetical protein